MVVAGKAYQAHVDWSCGWFHSWTRKQQLQLPGPAAEPAEVSAQLELNDIPESAHEPEPRMCELFDLIVLSTPLSSLLGLGLGMLQHLVLTRAFLTLPTTIDQRAHRLLVVGGRLELHAYTCSMLPLFSSFGQQVLLIEQISHIAYWISGLSLLFSFSLSLSLSLSLSRSHCLNSPLPACLPG